MKRLFHIFLAVIATVLLASCSGLNKLDIQNYRLGRVSPTGFRSATLSVDLKICNSGFKIKILDATGTLFAEDKAIGTFKIDPVTIEGHKTDWTRIDCALKLDDGFAIIDLLKTVRARDISQITMNCSIKARSGIFSKTVKKEKVPISSLIER